MSLAGHMHFWGGWGFLFGFAWLAFWIAVVFVLVTVLRRGSARTPPSSALRVLEERYARGEIDRDEFFERRRVLRGEPPAGGEPGPH